MVAKVVDLVPSVCVFEVILSAAPDDGVPNAPPETRFPEAVPVKAAVIVPALKLPELSRATIAELVLAAVAVVAEFETFDAVEIVASFVSTIPAEELISASKIVSSRIIPDVTVPEGRVTVPVNVGLASGAFAAKLFVTVVAKLASSPNAAASSSRVSSAPGALATSATTSALTNAVVASRVELFPTVCVGAVEAPERIKSPGRVNRSYNYV